MFRITAPRRELYGFGLGVLLLANLAGGAAVVVARASGPETGAAAPAAGTRFVDDPSAGVAGTAPATTDPSVCGTGTATATAVLDQTADGYVLRATVANDSDRTVELDRLTVAAIYGDGTRTFTAAATGHWISAGVAQTDFALPDRAWPTRPDSFGVADFAFHTAGRPGCAAR
jgi:hypothetical protein